MSDKSKKALDSRVKDWPGPVVKLDWWDWTGFEDGDTLFLHSPEKIVFERNGTLFIAE